MTRQGLPAAITLAGMSLVTTLPAPIIEFSPIVTPGKTLSLMWMGLAYTWWFARSTESSAWLAQYSPTLGPM